MSQLPKYEVHKLEGTVMRRKAEKTDAGIIFTESEEDAGYMVYFPRGGSIRVNEKRLKQLGYHYTPPLVDMETGDEAKNPAGVSLQRIVEQKSNRNSRRPAFTSQ